jgi:hypothetical protein
VISFCSCESKKINFSVTVPKGWLVIDTVDKAQERLLRIYPPPDTCVSGFSENIVIGIVQAENKEKFVEGLSDRLKHGVSFYKETGKGVIKVNSFEAEWVQYLIQMNAQSDTAEQKVYYIESEKHIFQIICTAKPHETGNISKEIDLVLNSFKVLN